MPLKPNILAGIIAGAGGAPVEFLYASSDNYHADDNAATNPISNASADSVTLYYPYFVESDLTDYRWVFDATMFGPAGETGLTNTVEIVSASTIYNGVSVPVRFSTSRNRVLAIKEKDIATDTVSASLHGTSKISAGTWIYIKAIAKVPAVGGNFLRVNRRNNYYDQAPINLSLGGSCRFFNSATATPSSTDAVGDYTFTSGASVGTSSSRVMGPMLVGKHLDQKIVAPLVLVDSIGTRYTSFLYELFRDTTIPFGAVARPGIAIAAFISDTSWQWRLKYCNDVYIYLGPNDFAALSGVSAATRLSTLQSRFTSLFTLCAGKRIHVSKITTTTSSTDNWLTVANQTETPHWRDTHDLLMSWLDTKKADGTIAYLHEIAPMLNESKGGGETVWNVDGVTAFYDTYDGLHLSNTGDNGKATIADTGVGRMLSTVFVPNLRTASAAIFGASRPTKPGLVVTEGNAKVTATVTASGWDGGSIAAYSVKYRADGSTGAFTTVSATPGVPQDITGLANGTAYEFFAVSTNSSGSTDSLEIVKSPTAGSYDANLSAIFDSSVQSSITKSSGIVSNWRDARGSAFNYTQATSANRPSQSADGAPITFTNDKVLTSDTALNPANFDIVFNTTSPITNTSTAANLIHFANAAPVSLAAGSSTGTFTDELLVFSLGTYRAAVLQSEYLSKTGNSQMSTSAHVVSVRYTSGSAAQIWVDGIQMTVVENGSNTQSFSNLVPTVGGDAGLARDLLGNIYEIRHYSTTPVTATATVHAELKTKWGIV